MACSTLSNKTNLCENCYKFSIFISRTQEQKAPRCQFRMHSGACALAREDRSGHRIHRPNGMPSIRKMRISLDDLAHKHSQELTRSFPISTYYAATWFSQLMPQS